MLLSLIKPDQGSIEVFGLSQPEKRIQILKRIGALIERPDFYPYLSAYKNLEILSQYSGIKPDKTAIFETLELVGLKERYKSKVKTFSHGMKQRLGVAQAILHNPELLILDEPLNGLDPQGTQELRNLIIHMNKEKHKTIFLSSHILHEIELIANRMIIINKGKAVVEGNVQDLLNSGQLKVTFTVSDVEKAREFIKNSGFAEYYKPDGLHDLSFTIDKEKIALVNRFLIEKGIDVYTIKPVRTLEEYFIKITEG